MASITGKKFKAVSGFTLIDRNETPNRLLVMPKPSNVVLQPGISEIITETRTETGDRVVESTMIDAYQPAIQVTLPGFTPETLAARLGKKLESATVDAPFERLIKVTATNQNWAGASTGQDGFGMAADQTGSIAYVLTGLGISTALTRVAYDGFDATTPDQFAQGANGAWKFSNNLIGSNVQLQLPNTVANSLQLGESPFLEFQVNVVFVMADLFKVRLEMPSAQVNLGEGDVSFGAEAAISFRSTYDGSSCKPMNVKFLNQVAAC